MPPNDEEDSCPPPPPPIAVGKVADFVLATGDEEAEVVTCGIVATAPADSERSRAAPEDASLGLQVVLG